MRNGVAAFDGLALNVPAARFGDPGADAANEVDALDEDGNPIAAVAGAEAPMLPPRKFFTLGWTRIGKMHRAGGHRLVENAAAGNNVVVVAPPPHTMNTMVVAQVMVVVGLGHNFVNSIAMGSDA